jgi:predicted RNA-binding Zn ribbon-like protein
MPDEHPIPDELDLIGAFVNTLHKDPVDPELEELDSPAALETWMKDHGIAPEEDLDDQDLASAIRVREALRRLLRTNDGSKLDPGPLGALREAAQEGLIRIEIDRTGRAVATPARQGLGSLFARLLAAVADSQAAGTWERMKTCADDDCEWAFYDSSKNRSRTWCSMEVCGNRAKTRAYRARRKKR